MSTSKVLQTYTHSESVVWCVCVCVQVNTVQTKLKRSTRELMAGVSELSMQQATAMRLYQELTEKRALLERYHVNMDNGLPPSVDVEHEFLRQMQLDQQRQHQRQHEKLVYRPLYLL